MRGSRPRCMTLQHLELLPALQADDVIREYAPLDGHCPRKPRDEVGPHRRSWASRLSGRPSSFGHRQERKPATPRNCCRQRPGAESPRVDSSRNNGRARSVNSRESAVPLVDDQCGTAPICRASPLISCIPVPEPALAGRGPAGSPLPLSEMWTRIPPVGSISTVSAITPPRRSKAYFKLLVVNSFRMG